MVISAVLLHGESVLLLSVSSMWLVLGGFKASVSFWGSVASRLCWTTSYDAPVREGTFLQTFVYTTTTVFVTRTRVAQTGTKSEGQELESCMLWWSGKFEQISTMTLSCQGRSIHIFH